MFFSGFKKIEVFKNNFIAHPISFLSNNQENCLSQIKIPCTIVLKFQVFLKSYINLI